jgi:hypothetical protein
VNTSVRVVRRRHWPRALLALAAAVGLLLLGPLGVLASGTVDLDTPWYARSSERTGLAPDPTVAREAVVQVYGARAVRWRGAFAIHPWIAVKRAGADSYTTYQVVGWRAMRGGDAVVVTEGAVPDRHWYGAVPQLLREHRGPQAQAMIERIEAAVQRYPWPRTYRAWPGPNSNTFVAWVAREVPELGLDLPAHAIGKDWLGPSTFVARAPSGTGWQVSAWGLAGVTLARDEGLELQLLGLGFGVDLDDARLRLPGLGSWPGP